MSERAMSERWWENDEQLVALLREAIHGTEPAPEELLAVGRSAYAWIDNDMELAMLAFDSTVDEMAEPVGVRASVVPLRALTFVSAQLTIELESIDGVLIGQIVPPAPGTVTVVPADGSGVTAPIDDVGGFTIRPVPAVTCRLEVRVGAGEDELTARTDWFRI